MADNVAFVGSHRELGAGWSSSLSQPSPSYCTDGNMETQRRGVGPGQLRTCLQQNGDNIQRGKLSGMSLACETNTVILCKPVHTSNVTAAQALGEKLGQVLVPKPFSSLGLSGGRVGPSLRSHGL